MTKHRKILVVDDEKNIRLMLSQALTSDDIQVETAVNAEEALDKLKDTTYDLVLLDLRLPGMDGLQALRQMHARDPSLHVILLTAHGTVENAVEAMRSGAVNYLQKPFAPREVRTIVDRVLQGGVRSRGPESDVANKRTSGENT